MSQLTLDAEKSNPIDSFFCPPEPEKLHVIQQYLRSSARNSSLGEPDDATALPASPLLDVLLNSSLPAIDDNRLPDNSDDKDEEPVFVTTAWTTPRTSKRPSMTSSTAITTTR